MIASPEVRAELLSPDDIELRLAESSIVYLPVGTLEFHGPHLPIGLDALNAHGVCINAAKKSGGLVLPPVYQGIGGGHRSYPWTIMMNDGDGVRAHLMDTLDRLDHLNVKTALIFSGHFAPEQLDLIDEVARAWNESGHNLIVIATAVNRCPTAALPPDHAGIFETTLLAGIAPELVHLDRLPSLDSQPASDPDGDPFGVHRHDATNPLFGVFGPDPRPADLSLGTKLLDEIGSWLAGQAADAHH